MYALFSRDLGNFQWSGEEVAVYWVTSRQLDMTIPGGVTLWGYTTWPEDEQGGLPCAELFRDTTNQSWKDALNLFAGSLGVAYEKKLEEEAGESAMFEALDYFKAIVSAGVTHGRKTMFVHAFRESEAAQAAFDAGIPAEKRGEYWNWPALGKLQEKTGSTPETA